MSLEPSAGTLSDQKHLLPVRVYFEDTDASGLVYHASYLRFFERGRTDFLRLLGIEQGARLAAGSSEGYFAVRSIEIEFLRPAFLDDALVVSTSLEALRGASLLIDQSIARQGEPVAAARVKVALLRQDGRPQRLSAAMRDKMLPYLADMAERGV
jgi:acyl-CoA thioester hydrolase